MKNNEVRRRLILYVFEFHPDRFNSLEIEYREKAAQQLQLEHEQHVYSQQLDHEVEYHKQLNGNYDHLQKQIKHCSTDLEKKNLLQEHIKTNIDRLHREIEDLQSRNHATIRVCSNKNNHSSSIFDYKYMCTQGHASI